MKYEDVLRHESEDKTTKGTSRTSRYPVGSKVEEPATELVFTVENGDVVGSVVADKESCAAARALCRMPDIEHVWVFRSRTLVKRSNGVIERYANPTSLTKAVEGFDNSAGLFPAGEYKLKPLSAGKRREAKRKWNETHRNRHGGKRPYEYVAPPAPLRKK